MTALVTGTVTFDGATATGALRNAVAGIFLLTPQRRRLTTEDSESVWPEVITLVLEDGKVSAEVLATTIPGVAPTGWTWRVHPELVDKRARQLPWPSFDIEVPAGGTVDLTAVAPVGTDPQGRDVLMGTPGRGITTVDTLDGDLIITYTDGTTINAGPLPPGPQGEVTPASVALTIPTPAVTAPVSTIADNRIAVVGNTRSSTGFLRLAGTVPNQVPVVKPNGDGRAGVWEMTHDDGVGYLHHLLAGPNMGHNAALVAHGVDNDGIGSLYANKKKGRGIVLDQQAGITAADAYGFHGTQRSILAPLMRLESNAENAAAALQLVAFGTPGSAQLLYVGDPTGEAGRIAAADGRILWQRDIRIRNSAAGETARYFEVGSSSAANANNTSKAYHGAAEDVFFAPTGTGSYYPYKFAHSASSFAIQTAGNVAPAIGTDPRPSEVGAYTTRISVSHTAGVSIQAGAIRVSTTGALGFFGAAAVARPAGVAVTPEAIHAALLTLGLITA